MPCYHPTYLYRSRHGVNAKTGKVPLVGYNKSDKKGGSIPVGCNRCAGCLLERSRQWAVRCEKEIQLNENNCFITLTIDDDHMVYGGAEHGILVPRDFTLFLKRLRKQYGSGIRFFGCGEYGTKSNRPHYHALIFGFDFPDKVYHSTKNGNILYHSDSLNNLWRNGNCLIGAATFESAAYVARYILKKRYGERSKYYTQEGVTPEFIRMSRRPGIGSKWFDKYKSDVFPHDYVITRIGIKTKPPKYFSLLYEKTNPSEMEAIKLIRQTLADKNWQNNEPNRLRIRERVKKSQIKTLTRNLD